MKKTYKIKALPANNNFIETILTQEEIDNYKKGGYFVEELETYQDKGEVISQYGWDYKKEGDKYLTKRSNSNKWIEATGEPLIAIKQKIYNEIPYTKEDRKSDYITNVQRLIDKGYTLNNLVEQRVGTREGLLNLFPSLETKKEVKKEVKKEEPETQEYIPTLSEIYNIEQSVIGKPKREYPISAKDLIEATKDFNKNKKEKVKDIKKEYPVSPQDIFKATREFNKDKVIVDDTEEISERPTFLPTIPTWEDAFRDTAYYSQVPEENFIETEATDKEIKELEKQGYKVEEVPTFDFNRELMQRIKNASNYEPSLPVTPGYQSLRYTPVNPPSDDSDYWFETAADYIDKGLNWINEKVDKAGEVLSSEGAGNIIQQIEQGTADAESLGEVKTLKEEETEEYIPTLSEIDSIEQSVLQGSEPSYNIKDLDPFKFKGERNGEIIETYSIPLIREPNKLITYRNRFDESDIVGKKVAYTYAPFKTYEETLNKAYGDLRVNDNTNVIALTFDGIKGGTLKDFKDTDIPVSPTYVTKNVTELLIEPSNKYFSGIEQKGLGLKKSDGNVKYIPIGTSDSKSKNFKNWSGGHMLVENPKTKVITVLHGRSDQLKEMFNKYLEAEGIESANIYETDHKAYSLITNPKDGIHKGAKNRKMDNYNTDKSGAGNFIYIKELKDAIQTADINPNWTEPYSVKKDFIRKQLK